MLDSNTKGLTLVSCSSYGALVTVQEARLNEVFRALADPTRRSVVERLGVGPASTSELAIRFDMTLPSFTEHLDTLERAGVVTSVKHGRVRTYRLTPAPLERATSWLGEQHDLWQRRLDQLDTHLRTMQATTIKKERR